MGSLKAGKALLDLSGSIRSGAFMRRDSSVGLPEPERLSAIELMLLGAAGSGHQFIECTFDRNREGLGQAPDIVFRAQQVVADLDIGVRHPDGEPVPV